MCGRYGRITRATTLARDINATVSNRLTDHTGYNLPPGTFQTCVLKHPDSGKITLGPAWWGFIPNWATDTRLAPINARSETAHEKKLFAKALAHQRCLIPADWWYEWQRSETSKQPFAIKPADGASFFFAGIWSKAARLPSDHPAAGQVTFAILTGPPNDGIAHIHHRQPRALTLDAARAWLDDETDPDTLQALLADGRHAAYESWPINDRVGSPANDDPQVIERIEL